MNHNSLLEAIKSKKKPPPPPPPRQKPSEANPATQTTTTATTQQHKPNLTRKRGLGWPWDQPASHFTLFHTNNTNTNTSNPEQKITWLFNWELWVPPGLPSNIEWTPCVRTATQVHDILPFLSDITTTQNRQIKHFLGFNEPEIQDQANLPVDEAVRLWREFVLPAKKKFGFRLGSPGMCSDRNKCKPWLSSFLNQLSQQERGGAGVDFLVVHWYGERFADMKDFLHDMHDTYCLPIWVNEFACSKMGSGTEIDLDSVRRFLREAIPWLDSTEWIERYAYYGNGQGRDVGGWVGSNNNFTRSVDGAAHADDDRELSEVGKLYLDL